MEIKLKLDTEKTAKAVVAIAAAYCRNHLQTLPGPPKIRLSHDAQSDHAPLPGGAQGLSPPQRKALG